MPTVTIAARVQPEFRARIYAAAEGRGQTAGAFIVAAIIAHIGARSTPAASAATPQRDVKAGFRLILSSLDGFPPAERRATFDAFARTWPAYQARRVTPGSSPAPSNVIPLRPHSAVRT